MTTIASTTVTTSDTRTQAGSEGLSWSVERTGGWGGTVVTGL
ncbi:MAG: hypothetical protein O3A25_08955 [Acidobacteria bacterium]|nr:hypothetical protein [Acidobacteriota bacterium]